eukprot:CAMPEP_0179257820 /NCGR_PEP_ID=MMETSP0797-20121207/24989_1 /TAXON_ID=47934 /ORGANISM="Dinophysis acuminata, Strain DAEP01" /LENGTH=229 /DNA_ID=CAMNT_0020965817 /DNA_START=197 /DNA_END=882 /DNA_ORIENTATION=-
MRRASFLTCCLVTALLASLFRHDDAVGQLGGQLPLPARRGGAARARGGVRLGLPVPEGLLRRGDDDRPLQRVHVLPRRLVGGARLGKQLAQALHCEGRALAARVQQRQRQWLNGNMLERLALLHLQIGRIAPELRQDALQLLGQQPPQRLPLVAVGRPGPCYVVYDALKLLGDRVGARQGPRLDSRREIEEDGVYTPGSAASPPVSGGPPSRAAGAAAAVVMIKPKWLE